MSEAEEGTTTSTGALSSKTATMQRDAAGGSPGNAGASSSSSSSGRQEPHRSVTFAGIGSRIRSGLSSLVGRRSRNGVKAKEARLQVKQQQHPSVAAAAAAEATIEEEREESRNRRVETIAEEPANDLASSSSDPVDAASGAQQQQSSFSDVESVPSFHTAEELLTEEDQYQDGLSEGLSASMAPSTADTSDARDTNDDGDVLLSPTTAGTSSDESFTIPSAIIGVQIQYAPGAAGPASAGPAARLLLDVVPLQFADRTIAAATATATAGANLGASNAARSTITEESYVSTSSGTSAGSDYSTATSSSGSSGGVLEIITGGRRHDDDYARPYYDLSVRPVVRKLLRRIEEDPPIY